MIPNAYVSMLGPGSRVEGLNARRDPPRSFGAQAPNFRDKPVCEAAVSMSGWRAPNPLSAAACD